MNGNHPLISTLILALLLSLGSACTSTNLTKRVLDTPEHQERRARLKVAEAMFAERCKKAGIFIHKKVEDVEGIFLMKIRPEVFHAWDQFGAEDPYGLDSSGDAYIKSFFAGPAIVANKHKNNFPPPLAYQFVEAVDPKDGQRYRYTGSMKDVEHVQSVIGGGDGKTKFVTRDFVVDRVLSPGPKPRYAVNYEDISTREEREYWIAGSSLKVIDLHTNEVVAERIGYLMDRGQGRGRSPWLSAADNACPTFRSGHIPGFASRDSQTRKFVVKVLIPKKENGK